jgi:hypothetical protein
LFLGYCLNRDGLDAQTLCHLEDLSRLTACKRWTSDRELDINVMGDVRNERWLELYPYASVGHSLPIDDDRRILELSLEQVKQCRMAAKRLPYQWCIDGYLLTRGVGNNLVHDLIVVEQ